MLGYFIWEMKSRTWIESHLPCIKSLRCWSISGESNRSNDELGTVDGNGILGGGIFGTYCLCKVGGKIRGLLFTDFEADVSF